MIRDRGCRLDGGAYVVIEVAVFIVAVAIGLVLAVCRPWGLDQAAAATLAGALFGGAAVMLGNGLNRWRYWRERKGRVRSLKTLIAAELVDVACGLLQAKEVMDAAITSAQAGGNITTPPIWSLCWPRPMPFTWGLGMELLALDQPAIDALTTLRSNLATTRSLMDQCAGAPFGLLKARSLSASLGQSMKVLSEAFMHIAPDRKFQLPGKKPELATSILDRASNPCSP